MLQISTLAFATFWDPKVNPSILWKTYINISSIAKINLNVFKNHVYFFTLV